MSYFYNGTARNFSFIGFLKEERKTYPRLQLERKAQEEHFFNII